jgi:hypothetical protein
MMIFRSNPERLAEEERVDPEFNEANNCNDPKCR